MDVTVTMTDGLLRQAEAAAAQDGKSLSDFVSEAVEQRVGQLKRRVEPRLTQAEALERFLAGPLMDLTDENGKAPSRDELIGRPRLR